MTTIPCVRDGCLNSVTSEGRGRPRSYCSHDCYLAAQNARNAERKAPPKRAPIDRAQFAALVMDGLSNTALAERFGVKSGTASKWAAPIRKAQP